MSTRDRTAESGGLLTIALEYAARGWHVFPLIPGGKTPAIPSAHPPGSGCRGGCGRLGHGPYDATIDPQKVRHWWTHSPVANVGIACGPAGLLVVDCDRPTSPEDRPPAEWADVPGLEDGLDVLAVLAERAGQRLPLPTYVVRTGRGGMHLYYRQPPGRRLGNSSGRLGWKIDTRGYGGYVVGAGSIVAGRTYTVEDGIDPAVLPGWLGQALSIREPHAQVAGEELLAAVRRRSAYAAVALAAELDRVLAAPEGRRNHTLNAAAYNLGQLVGAELIPEKLAADALTAAGTTLGLTSRETQATVRSGLSAGARHPRGVPA